MLNLAGAGDDVIDLDAQAFDSRVLKGNEFWVIEWYANWCGGECQSSVPQHGIRFLVAPFVGAIGVALSINNTLLTSAVSVGAPCATTSSIHRNEILCRLQDGSALVQGGGDCTEERGNLVWRDEHGCARRTRQLLRRPGYMPTRVRLCTYMRVRVLFFSR